MKHLQDEGASGRSPYFTALLVLVLAPVVAACDDFGAPGVHEAFLPYPSGVFSGGPPCGTHDDAALFCLPGAECLSERNHRLVAELDLCTSDPYRTYEPDPLEGSGVPCGTGFCYPGGFCQDRSECVQAVCPVTE